MGGNVRILRRFSKDHFEADVDRNIYVNMRRHQGAQSKLFDVSDVIYDKFSHGASSYALNVENAYVM